MPTPCRENPANLDAFLSMSQRKDMSCHFPAQFDQVGAAGILVYLTSAAARSSIRDCCMTQYVLTAEGPSGRGLVAGLATAAAAQSCNILDSAQFVDTESSRFFLRMLLRDEA